MTIQELITMLQFEDPTHEIVVTIINDDGGLTVYSLQKILGKGWKPSGIIEVVADEVILEN